MGKIPESRPPQVQAWTEARQRYHLSHAQVQMARELGLNPRKLGKIANHRQGTVESAIASVHRGPLPQEVRPGKAPGRHVGREMGAADRGQEGDAQCCSCGRLQ
jgi:hypothetical protein